MEIKWIVRFAPLGQGNYHIGGLSVSDDCTYAIGSYWTDEAQSTCVIAKYDADGEIVWDNAYKKEGWVVSEGRAIILRKEHGFDTIPDVYVLCAATDSIDQQIIYLLKYDSSGAMLWEKEIVNSPNPVSCNMYVDYSGYLHMSGWIDDSSGPIIFVSAHDPSGATLWQLQYRNPSLVFDDLKYSVRSGDEIIAGGVLTDRKDFFYIRYDKIGALKHIQVHETPEHEDICADVELRPDGSVYLTGGSFSNSNYDFVTLLFDSENKLTWSQRYDGEGFDDMPVALTYDDSNFVYVTGWSKNEQGDRRIVAVKYDTAGNELWANKYSGKKGESAIPYFAVPDLVFSKRYSSSPAFFVTGTVGSDVIVLKYSTNGFMLWFNRYRSMKKTCRPSVGLGKVVALEETSGEENEAYIIRYEKSEQFGIARWD